MKHQQLGAPEPRRVIYQGNWTELQRRRLARRRLGLKGEPNPAANVGQRHEDYGMTQQEHMFAKFNRPADSKAKRLVKAVKKLVGQ